MEGSDKIHQQVCYNQLMNGSATFSRRDPLIQSPNKIEGLAWRDDLGHLKSCLSGKRQGIES